MNEQAARGDLARRMRQWRLMHDITQAEAAQLVGARSNTWARWERGALPLEYRRRQQVIALLQTTPKRLVGAPSRARSAAAGGLDP